MAEASIAGRVFPARNGVCLRLFHIHSISFLSPDHLERRAGQVTLCSPNQTPRLATGRRQFADGPDVVI